MIDNLPLNPSSSHYWNSGSKFVQVLFNCTCLYLHCVFLFLSQARTWISNAICHGLLCVQWLEGGTREVIVRFVDIGRIVDHHCLSFLFIKYLYFTDKYTSIRYAVSLQNQQNIFMLLRILSPDNGWLTSISTAKQTSLFPFLKRATTYVRGMVF